MTFSLGPKSKANLVGVDDRLVSIVQTAIKETEQDFTVFEGLRTVERQRKLVASGASKTMASKHLKQPSGFGHAVDLVPWIDGQPRWEWGPIYHIALAMRNASIQHGIMIRWGGVWDKNLSDLPNSVPGIQKAVSDYCARHPGPDFIDGPHFELRA